MPSKSSIGAPAADCFRHHSKKITPSEVTPTHRRKISAISTHGSFSMPTHRFTQRAGRRRSTQGGRTLTVGADGRIRRSDPATNATSTKSSINAHVRLRPALAHQNSPGQGCGYTPGKVAWVSG